VLLLLLLLLHDVRWQCHGRRFRHHISAHPRRLLVWLLLRLHMLLQLPAHQCPTDMPNRGTARERCVAHTSHHCTRMPLSPPGHRTHPSRL
jgi:hypothetical protein